MRCRLAVVLTATLLVASGCSDDTASVAPASAASSGATTTAAAAGAGDRAEPGGQVGPGTACPLPVTFRLAAEWKPEAVTAETAEFFGDAGGLLVKCEIDAKPAGPIGFMRVWAGPSKDLEAALTAVIGYVGKPTDVKFTTVTVGGRSASEVSYLSEDRPGRAFAVRVGSGQTVVVTWSGLDDDEFEEGLPAYELARSSLAVP